MFFLLTLMISRFFFLFKIRKQISLFLREENHPALRTRGLVEKQNAAGSVNEVLDKNLDEMAMGLSRLKGLALDLNAELDEHDDILNRLDDKSAHAGIKVTKQNKDMSKLLKK